MKMLTTTGKGSKAVLLAAFIAAAMTLIEMINPAVVRADPQYCAVGAYCDFFVADCFTGGWDTCVTDWCTGALPTDPYPCMLGADAYCWCTYYNNNQACQNYMSYCD